jgi:hypothetical protein
MGGPVEVSGDQLRAIVERIEHIEEEIKELNEGKREIFQEAKSNGFDRPGHKSRQAEATTCRSPGAWTARGFILWQSLVD